MDTRLATNQIRLSEWTRIIKDRCQSGLKVDEYCEQHQLSRHAYYYWLRKVKEAALIHNSFVELPALPEKTVPVTISENLSTYQMTKLLEILYWELVNQLQWNFSPEC
jgi:transposase-like protein